MELLVAIIAWAVTTILDSFAHYVGEEPIKIVSMLGFLCLHGNSPWVKCLWMIRGPWWSKLSMKQIPSWAIFVCVKISESFPLRFSAQFTFAGFSSLSLVTSVLLIFIYCTCFLQIPLFLLSNSSVVVVKGCQILSQKWLFSFRHFIRCRVANRQPCFQYHIWLRCFPIS